MNIDPQQSPNSDCNAESGTNYSQSTEEERSIIASVTSIALGLATIAAVFYMNYLEEPALLNEESTMSEIVGHRLISGTVFVIGSYAIALGLCGLGNAYLDSNKNDQHQESEN